MIRRGGLKDKNEKIKVKSSLPIKLLEKISNFYFNKVRNLLEINLLRSDI
jgi:hypothetical protein